MAEIIYPPFAKDRGIRYWLRPGNLLAARRKLLRADNSNDWRYKFEQSGPTVHPSRSAPFSRLLREGRTTSDFRFVILSDTGEGDRSQYALVPLLRSLEPDFMIINGDLAYPAGRQQDYKEGFFRPYQNLRIPAWAVPGNHEYYSPNQGQEFYEIFCTQKWGQLWANHGLVLRPQPGTYWELREPSKNPPLVVIGLDSGKAGNLDKDGGGIADDRQHIWLESRLRIAEREGLKVIVLFHIPALVNGRHVSKLRLTRLHQILASSPSVKLVACGHIHNMQRYEPGVFQRYLREIHKAIPRGAAHYLVNGGGGAALGSPVFEGPYKAQETFPTAEQWKKLKPMQKLLGWEPLAKSWFGKLAIAAYEDAVEDADASKLLSFLVVDVKNGAIEVTPVFMQDVAELFQTVQGSVQVVDPNLRVPPAQLAACLQTGTKISL